VKGEKGGGCGFGRYGTSFRPGQKKKKRSTSLDLREPEFFTEGEKAEVSRGQDDAPLNFYRGNYRKREESTSSRKRSRRGKMREARRRKGERETRNLPPGGCLLSDLWSGRKLAVE